MSKRPPRPASTPWITPYLTVKDADRALEFYQRAFGFAKRLAIPGPDGRTAHAEMTWHDGVIMFGPERSAEGHSSKAPVTIGAPPPVCLYVYCDNVDAMYARASAAGARGVSAPQDMFYGDRVCNVTDPDGHIWYFATNVADFDPAKAPH